MNKKIMVMLTAIVCATSFAYVHHVNINSGGITYQNESKAQAPVERTSIAMNIDDTSTVKIIKKEEPEIKTTKKETTKTTKAPTVKRATSAEIAKYQAYAHDLVINTYGWSEADFDCLVKLWYRESGWDPSSHNKKSGAHGIPQSLPASKMASAGADYYTNGYTQIRWGLSYIKNRYGSPSGAWAHSQKTGWY